MCKIDSGGHGLAMASSDVGGDIPQAIHQRAASHQLSGFSLGLSPFLRPR